MILLTVFLLCLKLFACLLIADFVSGVGHWIQDRYFHSSLNPVGRWIAVNNVQHHTRPRFLLTGSYWSRNAVPVSIGICLLTVLYGFYLLSPFVAVTVLLATQSNEIHACAHRTDRENWVVVGWLQSAGILQSRRHHGHHHTSPYEANYCLITNLLNPILDKLNIWRGFEWVLLRVFRVPID